VRSDYPTLRKEREGWGTRRSAEGIDKALAFKDGRLLARELPRREFFRRSFAPEGFS
jgi:hypothetical protein